MGFLFSSVSNFTAVTAAVQNGIDGVHFQVAPSANQPHTFTLSEAKRCITYCATRGVQTYLHIVSHPTDQEMVEWADCLTDLLKHGLTGLLLRDVGVLRMARMISAEMPVFVAPEAGVLTVKAAKVWAFLGANMLWLSPHLSRERLAYILRHSDIPCGITVAGDICVGLPEQCHLRTAGRGRCELDCALPYGIGEKPEGTPFSPLPFSLHSRWDDLQTMGADALGIFKMFSTPEWLALTTRMWHDAMAAGQPPKDNDVLLLKAGFHPAGLFDASFMDEPHPHPEPVAENPVTTQQILAGLRESYSNTIERQRIPVKFSCLIMGGQPVGVAVEDTEGHLVKVSGPKPTRQASGLLEAAVNTQLYKLLGTPYHCTIARSRVESGLGVSMSVIADLRDEALEKLAQLRQKPPVRKIGQYHAGLQYLVRSEKPVVTVRVQHVSQLSAQLAGQRPAVLYPPLMELKEGESEIYGFLERGVTVCPWIPSGLGDHEQQELHNALGHAMSLGITQIASPGPDYLPMLQKSGLAVRGEQGTDVTNSQTLKEYKRLGFKSVLLSHELSLHHLKEMSHVLDTELPVYGRMPLLLTDHCLLKSHHGLCNCDNQNLMVDTTGTRSPMIREFYCRTGVYNYKKLFMGHRLNELGGLGLWGIRLNFVTENARECVTVTERYNGVGKFSPGEYTTGQYDPIE